MINDPLYKRFLEWRHIISPCQECWGTGYDNLSMKKLSHPYENTHKLCKKCYGSGSSYPFYEVYNRALKEKKHEKTITKLIQKIEHQKNEIHGLKEKIKRKKQKYESEKSV